MMIITLKMMMVVLKIVKLNKVSTAVKINLHSIPVLQFVEMDLKQEMNPAMIIILKTMTVALRIVKLKMASIAKEVILLLLTNV